MGSLMNTCPKIIEYGRSLGFPLECICDIEWRNVKGNQHLQSSCPSTTSGRIKDTCKISCEVNSHEGKNEDKL